MCVSSHSGSVIKKPQKAIVYSQRPDGSIVANLENQYSKEQHKDENTYRYEYDVKENWTVKHYCPVKAGKSVFEIVET